MFLRLLHKSLMQEAFESCIANIGSLSEQHCLVSLLASFSSSCSDFFLSLSLSLLHICGVIPGVIMSSLWNSLHGGASPVLHRENSLPICLHFFVFQTPVKARVSSQEYGGARVSSVSALGKGDIWGNRNNFNSHLKANPSELYLFKQ